MEMTSQVEKFAKVATQFCVWAEDTSLPPESETQLALQYLCELYQLALQLPSQFGDKEPPEVAAEAWKEIYHRFGSLPFKYYSQCFNPQESPAEPAVTADLADDLADIWRELKRGLSLYNAGYVQSAAWEWRQSFWQHWGRHASGGIYAMHCWLAENPQSAA